MSGKYKTIAELSRKARVSRPTFYKHLRVLMSDPEAAKVLRGYKPSLGFKPEQVDFLVKHLPQFNL